MLKLLTLKEFEAISFTTRFINRSKLGLYEKKETILIHTDSDDNISSSIMLTRGGQLLPVAENQDSLNETDFSKAVNMFGTGIYYINAIMGEKQIVDLVFNSLVKSVNPEKITEYLYHTMIISDRKCFKSPGIDKKENNYIFRKPEVSDIKKLLPLQEMYEKEEVLPSDSYYDPDSAKRYLLTSVKKRISVICEKDSKIISKANTNGDGINFSQIGGVFTLPEYRNRGIGKRVTGKLVEEIFDCGRYPSLFVKQNNIPAVAAYRKLGFRITSSFKIIYFF